MAALVAALWAYDGWNDLNMVSGEIRHPERTIPIALIAGVGVVAVLYMLNNAAVQYVSAGGQIAASQRPASDATAIAVGAWGAAIVSAGMALSMLVSAERHHHERRARSLRHGARWILLQGAWPMCIRAFIRRRSRSSCNWCCRSSCCCSRGNFRQLFSLAIFSEWLFYMIAASTVFVLRRKEPNAPGLIRPGDIRWFPRVFVLVAAVLLYFTFTENLRNSVWGCVLILSGHSALPLLRGEADASRVGGYPLPPSLKILVFSEINRIPRVNY